MTVLPSPRAAVRGCPCCCRWRSTRPTTICCPTTSRLERRRCPRRLRRCVPFGPQTRLGVVWDAPVGDPGKPVPDRSSRPSPRRLPEVPPLPDPLAAVRRVGRPLHPDAARHGGAHDDGGAQRCSSPPSPASACSSIAGAPEPPRMTPARQRALEVAADGQVRAKTALAAEAQCSTGVIDGLIEAGVLVEVAIPERRFPMPDPATPRSSSATCRPSAAHALRAAAEGGVLGDAARRRHRLGQDRGLLRGGGARAWSAARRSLIMLPEIALTSQFMDRFKGRFGCAAGASGTPPCPRRSARAPGARAASGEARVVVGARSALFLPFTDLGLIVVDEEHDGGFKQEDRVHYQARDMAVVRAQPRQASRRAGLGHALDREPRQRPHRPLPQPRAARPLLRRRAARRHAPSTCARTPPEPGRWLSPAARAARSTRRWARASRRCSSSTAAAMRR